MVSSRFLAKGPNKGRVLLAGGLINVADVATPATSAELYDPATATFAATTSTKFGDCGNVPQLKGRPV
jgi:hypothetical protein